jgi:hypothetical protein
MLLYKSSSGHSHLFTLKFFLNSELNKKNMYLLFIKTLFMSAYRQLDKIWLFIPKQYLIE